MIRKNYQMERVEMTLNELRYIVAVSQQLNFRRAAAQVFVSQPALSLAIQKLEQELGVHIFERSRTGVSITAMGELIVAQAQLVLEEAARIKTISGQGKDPLRGVLKVGAIYTVGPYVLPALIPILKLKAPEMPLDVEENLTANLQEQLVHGQLDVIIIALPFSVPGIATLPLYDENFDVLIPTSHAWAKKKNINAAELAGEKMLMLNSGHCFSNQVAEACPELNRRGTLPAHGNSLETIRNMVASGLGITVLPASANSEKYRNPLTRAIPFTTPAPSRRIALAWRKSFVREEAIEVLGQAIIEAGVEGMQPIVKST
jgi:LysR family hydrogen peroxide-inducible transcriptional activator